MRYTNKYKHIIEEKYNTYQEDERFNRKSQSFEFRTTMHYIQKYLKKGSKVLEIGAEQDDIQLLSQKWTMTSPRLNLWKAI